MTQNERIKTLYKVEKESISHLFEMRTRIFTESRISQVNNRVGQVLLSTEKLEMSLNELLFFLFSFNSSFINLATNAVEPTDKKSFRCRDVLDFFLYLEIKI